VYLLIFVVAVIMNLVEKLLLQLDFVDILFSSHKMQTRSM